MNRLMRQGIFAHHFHEEAQRALTHGGPLTPESAQATWDSLYNVIHLALWDESARWGDYRRDIHPYSSQGTLYKPDGAYATERNRLLNQYFPFRTATFIQQLRNKGWFPKAEAPAVFVDDTEIGYEVQPLSTESRLTMTGSNIYYTLDGSAPVSWFRNDAGALSPTAKTYSDGQNILEENAGIALSDTLTLRAICNVEGEWSPIVTFRLVIYDPDGLSSVTEEKPKMEGIFDLQGRRITGGDLRRGIFIVNGKKVFKR